MKIAYSENIAPRETGFTDQELREILSRTLAPGRGTLKKLLLLPPD